MVNVKNQLGAVTTADKTFFSCSYVFKQEVSDWALFGANCPIKNLACFERARSSSIFSVSGDVVIRKKGVCLCADVLAIYNVKLLRVGFIKVVAEITGDLVVGAYSIIDLSVLRNCSAHTTSLDAWKRRCYSVVALRTIIARVFVDNHYINYQGFVPLSHNLFQVILIPQWQYIKYVD